MKQKCMGGQRGKEGKEGKEATPQNRVDFSTSRKLDFFSDEFIHMLYRIFQQNLICFFTADKADMLAKMYFLFTPSLSMLLLKTTFYLISNNSFGSTFLY